LTAGFIIWGDTSPCFIIKAEGPILGNGSISDPALIVRNFSTGEIIDANNSWANHPSATLVDLTGFAPSNPKEAALAIRLGQGLYLAELYSVLEQEAGGDSIVAVTKLPEDALQQTSCDTERTPQATPAIDTKPGDPEQLQVQISQPIAESNRYLKNQPINYIGELITEASGNASYEWDFGAGAQVDAGYSPSAQQGIIRYAQAGQKTVRLTVSVNGLSQTTETVITIGESPNAPDRSGGK
jgi:hypothetical protein